MTSQEVSSASVYQVLLGIHVTLQLASMDALTCYVYMVADVAMLETKANVYALKVTMGTTVN